MMNTILDVITLFLTETKPARQFGNLCKFKSLSLFIPLEIIIIVPYTVYKHRKTCICMTKCRAGFATGFYLTISRRKQADYKPIYFTEPEATNCFNINLHVFANNNQQNFIKIH